MKNHLNNEEDHNRTIAEKSNELNGTDDFRHSLEDQEAPVDTSGTMSVTLIDVNEKETTIFDLSANEKRLAEAALEMRTTSDQDHNANDFLAEDSASLVKKERKPRKRSKRDNSENLIVRQFDREVLASHSNCDGTNEELATKAKKSRKEDSKTQDDALSIIAESSLSLVEDTDNSVKCDKVETQSSPVKLDAVTKTRVEIYKQKLADLLSLCNALQGCTSSSYGEEFSMLQEVYGLGKDHDIQEEWGANESLEQQQRKMSLQFNSVRSTLQHRTGAFDETKIVECPTLLRSFLGHYVQGKSLTLKMLTEQLLSHFDVKIDQSEIISTLSLWLEMEIKVIAQRHCYGARPQRPNIFEDTSENALWLWEVGNIEKVFSLEAQKLIRRMRKHRKRLGQQLRTLVRILHLLHQSPIDEVKVSLEEAKVARFSHVIESEIRRGKYRERKDNEKQSRRDNKEKSEGDKSEQKKLEKRKREEALEQERLMANERKKSMISYFRSIDSSGIEQSEGDLDPSNVESGMCISTEDLTSTCTSGTQSYGQDRYCGSRSLSEDMLSFDKAVHWVSTNKSFAEHLPLITENLPCGGPEIPNKSSKARRLSLPNWTCKRQRHEKLGILKLLQFAENHRPAFYGTFNKTSHLLRNGRRPFAQAKNVDYSIDSDDEWEEDEPGESLSDDSEHESEDEENCLDYNDSWLAHDDEIEYREDGQCSSDTELDDAMETTSGQTSHQSSKKSKRFLKRLLVQIEGPFFCQHPHDKNKAVVANGSCEFTLTSQLVQRLCSPSFESAQLRKAREFECTSAEAPSQINEEAK
uniref:Uncharacterized protein AlNc14C245G9541 n=1 Tax=Albugo laibachii Nc14 TaxID=890382 RepID=F0WT57_9STRA|nr:conserved hypothetical protein [Albugo laibachii Nc14]CCA25967.1 conserved hypothetical protein [Albugo laibachii Nc14]|eukprot:CCA25967.1 conserved hypothetical protein [Albugo laibachii Nc14]